MQNALANTADVTVLQAVIAALRQENEYLRWQLAKARRERFDRRSERGDVLNQLSLYPEESIEVNTDPAEKRLRYDRAGGRARASDCAWIGRSESVGPSTDGQVFRPLPPVPAKRHLCSSGRGPVPLDAGNWVAASSHLLRPLVLALNQYVMGGYKVHADDTPVPVLAPGRGKTKTARLWTYVRDDRAVGIDQSAAVWFGYSPDRKGEHAAEHLRHFNGIVQADGYAGFNQLYETGRMREAACWAHVLRKFYEIAQQQASQVALEAIARIGQLYSIESSIRGQPANIRQQVRQARAGPLMTSLHDWLHETVRALSRKSALTRYIDDGRIEIDNNTAERTLRGVVLGRKNYLFAGSDADGHSASALYSLLGTAALNGVEPMTYLREVLARIAGHPVNRINELLPWNLAPQRYQAKQVA